MEVDVGRPAATFEYELASKDMILAPPDERAKSMCVMVRSETSSKSGKAWRGGTIDRSSKNDDGGTHPDRNGPLLGFGSRKTWPSDPRSHQFFGELDNFVYPFFSFTHRQSND
jgi:hypothetical protein